MNLKKGINFGGWLSQCVHTEAHYDSFISEDDVKQVAKWGFDHIRLPFDYELVQNEKGTFIEKGFKRLENFVLWCKKQKLNVILDLHKAFGYDFNDAGTEKGNSLFDSEELQDLFLSLWNEISLRFGTFENVAFELLNEVVEENAAEPWNKLIEKAVKVIRKNTVSTKIIYGGIQWNSANTVKLLEKPLDKNIILTFHMYEPLIFTHQKAHWVPGMDKNKDIHYPESMEYFRKESLPLGYKGKDITDTVGEYPCDKIMEKMVIEAYQAAQKHGVEIYCGEYGVINQAPVKDTLAWFRDIHKIYKKYNVGSAMWSYKKMDFGLTEPHYDEIRTEMLNFILE